jgi:hypothetical protein
MWKRELEAVTRNTDAILKAIEDDMYTPAIKDRLLALESGKGERQASRERRLLHRRAFTRISTKPMNARSQDKKTPAPKNRSAIVAGCGGPQTTRITDLAGAPVGSNPGQDLNLRPSGYECEYVEIITPIKSAT